MNEHSRRFVLWVLMVSVAVFLFLQEHLFFRSNEKVPFLPERSAMTGGMIFRLEGNCVKSGVYQFGSTVSLGTVINMTVPFLRGFSWEKDQFKKVVYTGDVVSVTCGDGKHIEIKRDSVSVVEKIILGLPLDPNRLTVTEWELLPRIGPTLARKIVVDRQKNGDFRTIRDLVRVSGVGAATVRQLSEYFGEDVVY